jgi:hypothetical protein
MLKIEFIIGDPPPLTRSTRLDYTKWLYVTDRIDVDELERRVARLLTTDTDRASLAVSVAERRHLHAWAREHARGMIL